MTQKVFARQVSPQYQESPMFLEGLKTYFDPEYGYGPMILAGNRDFCDYTTEEWDLLKDNFDEAASDYLWHYDDEENPCTVEEVLDYAGFERPDGKPWTAEELEKWKTLFLSDDCFPDEEIVLPALKLLTGKTWVATTIRGYSQGEWQTLYYPSDVSNERIREVEADYFNTGSEWIIHDEAETPVTPEDISGFCKYCYSWDIDGICEEIANDIGVMPEDVVLVDADGIIHGDWPSDDDGAENRVV